MDRSDLLGLWRFVHHSTGRALLGFAGLFLVAVVLHTAWESMEPEPGTW